MIRRIALAAMLLASLAAAGCSLLPPDARFSGVIQPTIVPSLTERGSSTVERDFAFEDAQIRLQVPIDQAVYAGAVSAQKSAIFVGQEEPADWVAGYYRAFVDEKHQAAFYDSMTQALDDVRQQNGLDSARYVELVTSMAQQMEYRVDPGNLAPKFPIETFGDGYGDCDDKTLLAAGILSRAGYDVAILLFSPEKHVALGIRAPGLDYENTGYAYVEMTAPSLVGVPTEELSEGAKLTSQPEVIRIGAGKGAYTAGAEIVDIQRRLAEVQSVRTQLRDEIETETENLKALEASLVKARQELQSAKDSAVLEGDVERYNQQVRVYNDRAQQLEKSVERYNALVDAERFVADNKTARPQVYQRLRDLKL